MKRKRIRVSLNNNCQAAFIQTDESWYNWSAEKILRIISIVGLQLVTKKKIRKEQGHHNKGDQVAGRPHIMCSISGRRLTTPLFGVRGDLNELIR